MKVRGYVRLAVLALLVLGFSGLSFGQISVGFGGGGFGVGVSIGVAPPPLPVYDQPPVPEMGYVWTPGYWAWDDDDGYYWVPGTWVQPPEVGMVWTPGYWGWNDGDQMYGWNEGYWGTEVGYYGGIDYGYGYPGEGFYGGRWQGNQFYYNQAVNTGITTNVVTTVYRTEVPANARSAEHVSFNGGQGGTQARPTQQQQQARQTAKVHVTSAQTQQMQAAKSNPQTHAKNNGGKPAIAATSKPGDMSHAVQAKAAGGHVDQKSLQANSKSAPVKHNGGNAGAANAREANQPATRGNENNNARETGRAVPKPSNASPESNTHARETEPSANRPADNRNREAGNASGMPQSEGSRRTTEPSNSHSNAPAAHEQTTPNHGAAAKEAPEKSNEKAKPEKSEKPDKNEKPQ